VKFFLTSPEIRDIIFKYRIDGTNYPCPQLVVGISQKEVYINGKGIR